MEVTCRGAELGVGGSSSVDGSLVCIPAPRRLTDTCSRPLSCSPSRRSCLPAASPLCINPMQALCAECRHVWREGRAGVQALERQGAGFRTAPHTWQRPRACRAAGREWGDLCIRVCSGALGPGSARSPGCRCQQSPARRVARVTQLGHRRGLQPPGPAALWAPGTCVMSTSGGRAW